MSDFAVRADPGGALWLTGEFDLAAEDEFQAAVDAALDAQRELVTSSRRSWGSERGYGVW